MFTGYYRTVIVSTRKITERSLFSDRLRVLRAQRTKAEFARFLGFAAPVYQRYEDGRVPQHKHLSVIADRCHVTVDWLLGRVQNPGGMISEERPVVREKPDRRYGDLPEEYDVRWTPQWNARLAAKSRDEICEDIEDRVPRLRSRAAGTELAHLCHDLMDFLNELANRRTEKMENGKRGES
jgi:transcriptional regulator with XRE-family HTH domain